MKLLLRVYTYLKPYWKQVLLAYLSLVGILGLSALIPQFIRWIIDTGIEKNQLSVLTWSVLALLGLTIVKGVLNYYQGILSETASQNVAYDLRNAIQRKLTQLSFSFHDTSETGELLSRAIQDVERLRFLTGRATLRIADGILTILVTIIILMVMDVRLGLLVLISVPILVHRAYYFGSRFRPLALLIQQQLARLTTAVEQNLRGSRVVKAYAQEPAEIEHFEVENNEWFQLTARSAKLRAINLPLITLISNISMVSIYLLGGYLVINQQITFGVLLAFITYLGQLVEPIRRLGIIIPAVAIASSSAERVFDILDTVPDVKDDPQAELINIDQGHVRFENVSFSYGKQTVLKDIEFEANPGQIVALLGATGSGKSTIISLIPRFYDPTQGKVMIDNKNIRAVQLQSLRSQIGIVLQETTLFAATIRENISFGQTNASEEEIIAAAKAAQAHEFIERSPKGYDTHVGERGITLSGGQKQRIAIARVLLMDPKILILDDATASVDTETEHLIQKAFENLIKGRTTFVIAHRLSTVRNADMILVLDGGRVVARGQHAELIKSSPQYLEIYNQQLKNQEEPA
ncbi:MAG TPA: ABC transporter ATP-binding protein [Brevefilum sp.]